MLKESPLGQNTVYIETYSPDLLGPIPRTLARDKIGIDYPLPFEGIDIWNAFEISWLNPKGKPQIALAELSFPCTSPNIVELNSLKLYFNSFNQTQFDSFESVKQIIEQDLNKVIKEPIAVELYPHATFKQKSLEEFSGTCLDNLDVQINTYNMEPKFLFTQSEKVQEA